MTHFVLILAALTLVDLIAVIPAAQAAPPAAVAPKAVSPAERLDALDFDNGAILIKETGSYASGIASWSAWHLTDGNEGAGWCSPKGAPVGSTFEWDLDTTWDIQAFAVSTRNMQEGGYPGISAKAVELWLDGGGSWRKVGTFQIGKLERKEYPLPAGSRARQVRLVVAGNHGNAEYTEIAEIDLFGTRATPAATARIAGNFKTNYGPLRFVQEGEEVFGCYDWADVAAVWGTVVGRNARVVWYEERGASAREGTATFALAPGGDRIWGVWYEGGQLKGEWAGPRIAEAQGPKCTPRKKGQLEDSLRRKGRVVLYGIRFDSNSDVPRAESKATIVELAALLRKDPTLRLLVEGHTDSTNTDSYNLDLSERRARSVVTALVALGIDSSRLQAKGFGRSRPVADNATAEGRALNRRVEVSRLE
jgi:outer membrane protein OmpA-like peptidoglycan-associated protein